MDAQVERRTPNGLRTTGADPAGPGASGGPPGQRLLRFSILGPIEVSDGERPLALTGRRQIALLALLLINKNRAVSCERLTDGLWGEPCDPGGGSKRLQMAVARLRRVLDAGAHPRDAPVLRTVAGGYLLAVGEGALDADVYEERWHAGRRALDAGEPAAAARVLREALALWRGPALADIADDDFARIEAARLEELRFCALEARIEADLQLGAHAELIGELEALAAAHPTRERISGHLMLALYRCGRQAEALDAYQRTRRHLMEELGLEPGPALTTLQAAILRHTSELEAEEDAQVARPGQGRPAVLAADHARRDRDRIGAPPDGARRQNLPLQLTSFVGRELELEHLAGLLARTRLVTLTGVGGAGKTRLALEAAGATLTDPDSEAWLVDLAAVVHGSQVAARVAQILGLPEQDLRAPGEALAQHLRARRALLVLDSCEHLVDACAELAADLLATCRHLRVLATSRRPLGVPGEVSYPVPALAVPDGRPDPLTGEWAGDYAAVQLFLDRALAIRPRLDATPHRLATIARICAALDGLPLAIELAASRIDVLTVEEIEANLGDRFRFLRARAGRPLRRHLTLVATMEWSYRLLSADEQAVLDALSVFAGGFRLEAVAEVCELAPEAALDIVAGLVDASLVLAEEHAGRTRYRLLETVRQYAAERLAASGDLARLERAHARHFLGVAQAAEPMLTGSNQRAWLDRLAAEHDNLRRALDWFVGESDGQAALELTGALFRFWYLRGAYREGREWLERALAIAPDAGTAARAKALRAAGTLAFLQCDYVQAQHLLGVSMRVARALDDRREVALALQILGSVARERAEYGTAVRFHEESLEHWRALDDRHEIARSLNYLAFAAWLAGDHVRSQRLTREAMPMTRLLGDGEGIAWSLLNEAAAALHGGRSDLAGRLCEEPLALSRDIGFREGVAWSLDLLGVLAERAGDLDRAARCLAESLAAHTELGDRWRAASVIEALGRVAVRSGDPERAAHCLGAAEALREATGTPVPACERAANVPLVAAVRAGSPACRRAWERARTMPFEDAGAEILAGCGAQPPAVQAR